MINLKKHTVKRPRILLYAICAFLTFFAQQISYSQIGINTTSPDPSSMLDINASDKGLLIPRISLLDVATTSLDGTNTAATGLMIYNTNASVTGGSGIGYYMFNGTSWEKVTTTADNMSGSDADFYEVGTTDAPDNINDEVYRLGSINVGANTTSSDAKIYISQDNENEKGLEVFHNGTVSINQGSESIAKIEGDLTLNSTIATTVYGLDIDMDADVTSGFGQIYGTRKSMQGNHNSVIANSNLISGSSATSLTGARNEFGNTSTNFQAYGTYNYFRESTNGGRTGTFNTFGIPGTFGANTTERKGVENYFNRANTLVQHYGVKNTFNSAAGDSYGVYNEWTTNSIGSNGNKYGMFTTIATSTGGTHYGVYSDVLKTGSYAGYFLGRLSIGTTTSDNYILPASRGTADQIMQTDGSGNVNWVDASTIAGGDADFYEVGQTRGPDNINDDIFTNGNVGINTTPNNTRLAIDANGDLNGILLSRTIDSYASNRFNINSSLSGIYTNSDPSFIQNRNYTSINNATGVTKNFTSNYTLIENTNVNSVGYNSDIRPSGTNAVNTGFLSNFSNNTNGIRRGFQSVIGGDISAAKIGLDNTFSEGNGVHRGVSNAFFSDDASSTQGIYTRFLGDSNSSQFGLLNDFDNDGNGDKRGVYNSFNGNGSGNKYGIYNTINNSSDDDNFGVYNRVNSSGNGLDSGSYSYLTSESSSSSYGNYVYIDGVGSGNRYGTSNQVVSNTSGDSFGTRNIVSGSSSGIKYGSYNQISSLSGGIHYGIYSNVVKSNSYAGYFLGKLYLGTNTTNGYILPTSRGTANQIMQTDGSGNVSWVDASSVGSTDADFYEVGTTSAPDNINDDIYTQGNVAIGRVNAFYPLDISATGLRAVNVLMDGTDDISKSGTVNTITNDGDGQHQGVYNIISGDGSGDHYGVYNTLGSNGTGNFFGTYSRFNSTSANEEEGIRNEFIGDSPTTQRGVNNRFTNDGSGNRVGISNTFFGTGDGLQTGVSNVFSNTGNGVKVGFDAVIAGGNGDRYGFRTNINTGGGGTHYGINSVVLKPGSFSGYFLGNVAIGTNSANTYILPASRGTAGQIMQTDGAGNVSWANAPSTSIWEETVADQRWSIPITGTPTGRPQLKYDDSDLTGILDFGAFGTFFGTHQGEDTGMHTDGDNLDFISPGDGGVLARFWEEDADNIVATISPTGIYTQVSDRNLKTNIRKLSDGLKKIKQLNGYRYSFKQSGDDIKKNTPIETTLGIMADELEKIAPELVYVQDTGNKTVNYAGITPLLIEAVKELSEENKTLKEKQKTLEKRLEKIEALLLKK